MSRINTGLGWSCNSDYYINDANTFLCTLNGPTIRSFYKYLEGPAVAFFRQGNNYGSNFNGPVLLSTNYDYVKYSILEDSAVTGYNHSAVIDGVRWYQNSSYHYQNVRDYTTVYPTYVQNALTDEEHIRQLLEIAGIINYHQDTISHFLIPVQWNSSYRSSPYETSFTITVNSK